MIRDTETERFLNKRLLHADIVCVGGGMAGVCCAITSARAGAKVVLIQDRPVLGGNASSEVRLWILGATSHMGNNNRWAREGGVIDEILVENLYRNREGNAVILDSILLEKVTNEPNITLLLNTAVCKVDKVEKDTIRSVTAFCSQNSTLYTAQAPVFVDASGDGIVGYLAGAAFRMGAEVKEEFDEGFVPDEDYGELLGHSLYFYTKDTHKPVRYTAPAFAQKDVESIYQWRRFNAGDQGCNFWWIEYGGRLDTVHDTEKIKWELWRVVYGIWDHIKNSGKFPEADTLSLEWVGMIPGKRESRRFEGDYMLTQQDVIEQRTHDDAVSFGGWAVDLHPADGVHSHLFPCTQWHSKGVYQIPYRAYYSRNVRNLFLAGRIISASHVAFGSSRVMATCAHGGQAVGVAATLCVHEGITPRDLCASERMERLQRDLLRGGQYIPGHLLEDPEDLVQLAKTSASSALSLSSLSADGPSLSLSEASWGMLLPAKAGKIPVMQFTVSAQEDTILKIQLRASSKRGNFTPDLIWEEKRLNICAGEEMPCNVVFDKEIPDDRYIFVCLMENDVISVRCSEQRISGVLAVTNQFLRAVAKSSVQDPPEGIGVERFEFWRPMRRPNGHNLAVSFSEPLHIYSPEIVCNGMVRPVNAPNVWVADFNDASPFLSLKWAEPQTISRVELTFDSDLDHPLESVLMGHPEDIAPFLVTRYRLLDAAGKVLHVCDENHQTRNTVLLDSPVRTDKLVLEILETAGAPAAVFEVRCY